MPVMKIHSNVSLKQYSTMRLGGLARYLTIVNSTVELTEALTWAERQDLQVIVIGSGSNIVWKDSGFGGLVIVNQILGWQIREIGGTDSALFTIGAGENWDNTVEQTVKLGYSGLENLSLIPGTVGAGPVQNIGAYGAEIKDTLVSVRVYDRHQHKFTTLTNRQCQFSYRDSCFKSSHKNRYIIVAVTLKLHKQNQKPPFYDSLQKYLDDKKITSYTPINIRLAIIAIRKSKLPDPTKVANNGSFFANPIISIAQADKLLAKYPNAPYWKVDKKIKLSSAWLIEQAGYKRGHKDIETGMALWKDQALVLVNEKAQSTNDLLIFKQKITTAVEDKFGILLQQEPELI